VTRITSLWHGALRVAKTSASQHSTALRSAVPPRHRDRGGWRDVSQPHSSPVPPGDEQNPQPPRDICLQSPFSLSFTGQEPISTLGVVLAVGLALLILVLFGYTFVRWYQRGQCWRREYGQSGGTGSSRAGGAQMKMAWDVGSMPGTCWSLGAGDTWGQGGSGASWRHAEAEEWDAR